MPDCNYCLTQCNVYPDGNITKINSVMYTKTQGCSVFNSRKKNQKVDNVINVEEITIMLVTVMLRDMSKVINYRVLCKLKRWICFGFKKFNVHPMHFHPICMIQFEYILIAFWYLYIIFFFHLIT
jgi:hypothetical protein